MPRSDHTPHGPPRRSRSRLLAAALGAVTILGAAAGAGDALAAACPGAKAQPTQVSSEAITRATLCMVNAERASRGLGALRLNPKLSVAARRHSSDMVRRQYFSHTAPGGTRFVDRIRRTGYLRSVHHWVVAENIAWGARAKAPAGAIVSAWMHSPPHREAILTRTYRDAGVGVSRGVPSPLAPDGATYTIEFGAKR
jgi:uncharacterized protein YkwD